MERKTRLELATVCLEGSLYKVFTVFTDFIKFTKTNKIDTFHDFIFFIVFINFIEFIKIGWKLGGKIVAKINPRLLEEENRNNETKKKPRMCVLYIQVRERNIKIWVI